MLKTKIMAVSSVLALCAASCSSDGGGKVIEKPEVNVVDGRLTPEILQSFGNVSSPQVSPDGKSIIFTLSYNDIEENKGNAEIYRMDIDGKNLKRLTKTAVSEHNIRWIDGGNKIAYLAKDNDTEAVQMFVMNANGGSARRVSEIKAGVECFEISPDETKVIFASNIKPFDKDTTLFEGLPKTTGRIVDDLMYKHWDEWVDEIPHPFLADFSADGVQNAIDIMEGEPYECPMKPYGGAETFAWAPDSKSLVYTCRKLTGKEYSFSTDSGLYLYDIASKSTRLLTEGMEGYDTDPKFSPDGKTLAWLSMETPGYESDKKRLMVMDMATGEKTDLTSDWDFWPEQINWRPDSKSLVFTAYYLGEEPVFDIEVATKKINQLSSDEKDYWDFNSPIALADGSVIAMRQSMKRPNEICHVAKDGVTQLTTVNDELVAQLKDITVEKRIIKTTDGKDMTAWVVLPPNFDPNKKYPALLYCQGGPQQAVSQFWSLRWNFRIMAANGYIVIAPNRRGVPGFGTEWNRQISGDYTGQNMKDYLAAVDQLKEEPYVDGDHFGAVGASYGGFSVYWLAGHHEGRFAALIAHAGIFNLEAQYLETEEMWFAQFDFGGAPWDKNNPAAQRTYADSPHLSVDKWTAPILVTVGELDYRILASQGMMAFNAAKMQGLETEMVVFPDENHTILKPQNSILWQRAFFRFLDKYLKTEKNKNR